MLATGLKGTYTYFQGGGGQQACVDALLVSTITGLGGRVEGGGVRMRRNVQKNKRRTLCYYLETSVLSRRARECETVCGAGAGDSVLSHPQCNVWRCINGLRIWLHLDVHSSWQREITCENMKPNSE